MSANNSYENKNSPALQATDFVVAIVAKKSFGSFEFAAPVSVAEPEKPLTCPDVTVAASSADQPSTSDSLNSSHGLWLFAQYPAS